MRVSLLTITTNHPAVVELVLPQESLRVVVAIDVDLGQSVVCGRLLHSFMYPCLQPGQQQFQSTERGREREEEEEERGREREEEEEERGKEYEEEEEEEEERERRREENIDIKEAALALEKVYCLKMFDGTGCC